MIRFRRWPLRSVWVKSGYQCRIHHLLNRWLSELARRGVDVDLGATAAESGSCWQAAEGLLKESVSQGILLRED